MPHNLVLSLAIGILLSLVTIFLTELLHQTMNLQRAVAWVRQKPLLYLVVSLAPFSLYLLVLGLFGSIILSCFMSGAVFLLTGIADLLVQHYRGEPFYPRELSMALNLGRLLTMISTGSVIALGGFLLFMVVLLILLLQLLPAAGLSLSLRSFFILLGGLAFAGFCTAGLEYNPMRRMMVLAGADFETPGKNHKVFASFDENGFAPAFLALCFRPLMERPRDYSQDAIAKLAASLPVSSVSHGNRSSQRPHIIFIMSEAFSDPCNLEGITLSEDPIPDIRKMMREYPSGSVLCPSYGGGTAHCEFEALTGFSTTLTSGASPFENNINRQKAFPSLPRHLLELGYDTIALHPYKRGMYARTQAYPALGINTFIDITGMRYTDKAEDNPYVSDAEAYKEAVELLQQSGHPTFLHLVTMQNHGDYTQKKRFHNTIRANGLSSEKDTAALETYLQGLRHTDNATADLIKSLQQLDSPVLLLFWGDHLPGAYPPAFLKGYYRKKYETPFFLWSNSGLTNRNYGLRSPLFLPWIVGELTGLPPTPHHRLLGELQKEIHGLHVRMLVNNEEQLITQSALSSCAQERLRQLHLLQYDMMLGERHAEAFGFFRA